MLFNYNRYHNAVFLGLADEVTGKVNKQYNRVEYYLQLKRTNDSLVRANEKLYNLLKQDFQKPDTINKIFIDTLRIDSLKNYRKYLYMAGKVIGNSVNAPNNYIRVERGSKQDVSKDLGVIDINGNVVGTIIGVSDNYSVVMSLLHKQSNISGKLKKTGETGSVIWDGTDPRFIIFKDIAKGVKVTKGDSVITSGFSEKFPYGKLIGIIEEIMNDKSTNTYTLKLRTAANFYNLEFIYIIDNLQKNEPDELLKTVKKVHE